MILPGGIEITLSRVVDMYDKQYNKEMRWANIFKKVHYLNNAIHPLNQSIKYRILKIYEDHC